LTDEVKAERLRVSREVWGHFEKETLGFLQQLVIGDETWVHHYDPEYKRHSIEYCHKASPVPKKHKTKASAGKIMLTLFLHSEDVVLNYFLEQGARVNSENYTDMLKYLSKSVTRRGAETDVCFNKTISRPQTSATTTDAFAHLGFTVLPHLAYCPDLSRILTGSLH
jgi:hypothetical protein